MLNSRISASRNPAEPVTRKFQKMWQQILRIRSESLYSIDEIDDEAIEGVKNEEGEFEMQRDDLVLVKVAVRWNQHFH